MKSTPIVALDVPDAGRAMALVRLLGESCGFYKVGSELFTAEGPHVVSEIRQLGKRVFLDLKFHDIPNTVRAACATARRSGASLVTVHASGGLRMLSAAVEGAGDDCGVLAVTILTSMDPAELGTASGRPDMSVSDEVSRLAALAGRAGVHGVVCSGHEVARIRTESPADFAILVPGIRLAGGPAHDQRRVMLPADAVAAGATYLVIGRAVTAAQDPLSAMREVNRQIAGASAGNS